MPIILLLILPILEITSLVVAALEVGFLTIVLWTIVSAYLGRYILSTSPNLRQEAGKAYSQINTGGGALNMICRFLGAIFLIIPGLITDTFGLLLLIPFVQRGLLFIVLFFVPAHIMASINTAQDTSDMFKDRDEHVKRGQGDEVIDAEYTVVKEEKS